MTPPSPTSAFFELPLLGVFVGFNTVELPPPPVAVVGANEIPDAVVPLPDGRGCDKMGGRTETDVGSAVEKAMEFDVVGPTAEGATFDAPEGKTEETRMEETVAPAVLQALENWSTMLCPWAIDAAVPPATATRQSTQVASADVMLAVQRHETSVHVFSVFSTGPQVA